MTDMRQTPTTVTDDSVSTRQQGHMPAIPGKRTAPSLRCAVQGRRRPRVHRPGAGGQCDRRSERQNPVPIARGL